MLVPEKSLVAGIVLDLTEDNVQVLFEIGDWWCKNCPPISSLYLFWPDCVDLKSVICADEMSRLFGNCLPIPVISVTKPAREYMAEQLRALFLAMPGSVVKCMEDETLLSRLSQTSHAIDMLLVPSEGPRGMVVLESCYAEIFFYGDKISADALPSAFNAFGSRDRRFGGYSKP